MLKIQPESHRDLLSFPCSEVSPGGKGVRFTEFPITQITATLPPAFDAIIILGDMQAMDSHLKPVENRSLLGIGVADELSTYCELGLWPSQDRVLVCLTGDLYTVDTLDKRGGTGDILSVYRAFASQFSHVCAVAGNHDLFGDGTSIQKAEKTGVRVLHGSQVQFGEFRVGGICGIAGNNGKVWRNTSSELKALVRGIGQVDLLLVHEPPKREGCPGNPELSSLLERNMFKGTIAAGHVRWDSVINQTEFGTVLNLDGRGVILTDSQRVLIS